MNDKGMHDEGMQDEGIAWRNAREIQGQRCVKKMKKNYIPLISTTSDNGGAPTEKWTKQQWWQNCQWKYEPKTNY